MPSIFSPLILSAYVLVAVTGCGGGGSSSNEAPSEDKTSSTPEISSVSLDQVFVQAEEHGVLSLAGQFVAPDSLSLSQSPDIGLAVISFQDNEVSLRIPGVDRPSLSELELTFVYGDQSIVRSLSLFAQNTSAENSVRQVQDTLKEKESVLELTQDFTLYRFFIDYAYLYNLVTYTEREWHLAQFSPLASASGSLTSSAIDNLAVEFEAYQQGRISDQALGQALSLAEQSIIEHGRYGSRMLDTIQPFVEVLVPGLNSGELVYVSEVGIYSRFLSAPLYGQLTEAGFEMAQPYEPIESLIRTRKSQPLTCERF